MFKFFNTKKIFFPESQNFLRGDFWKGGISKHYHTNKGKSIIVINNFLNLKKQLKTCDLVELHENYGIDSFSKLFPFTKKENLDKNISLIMIYTLMEKENDIQ